MMKTTWLLVVFTLLVVLYQATAVPVASSYKLENENFMEVMEAKEKAEEASDDDKAKDEEDEEASKEDEEKEDETKNDEDDKDDEDKKEDEEKKDDDDKKEDEESKDDDDDKKDEEEKKEDKEEEDDKEEEPDLNDQQNDQDSSGEENVDLDSEHLVLQGSGNGKIKGVVIEDSDKEKDKPEKRSVDDDKKAVKSTQGKRGRKRCGGYGFGGCGGCGGLGGYGGYGGFGGCGGYGFGLGGLCDWCADGTMCANCKGGFGPPIGCGGCNCGCSPSLTFPCVFGASVNNPGCECCKKKPPKGKCIWPCMWPCCCECDPPKFKFKPLEPKPVCHCPHKRYYRLHQSQTNNQGPLKRNLLDTLGGPFPKVFAPFSFPIVNGLQIKPQGFLQVPSNSEPNQPV